MRHPLLSAIITLLLGVLTCGSSLAPAIAQGRPDLVWMRGGSADVQAIAYSPNGEWIASSDGTIKLWRVSDKMMLRTVGSGAFVAFSSDSKTLSGAGGNTIRFWHTPDATLVRTITVSATILSYALSADGQHFAVGLDNHQVQIWRIADSQLLYTLQGHTQAVQSLSFTGDGQLLASGGAAGDDHVRIWRVSDGSAVQTLDCPGSGYGDQVAFAPNGTLLVVALLGANSFQIWRTTDWTLALRISAGSHIDRIAVSPDSSVVGVASASAGIIYRLSDGTRLVQKSLEGFSSSNAMAFSPDNKTVIYCEADTPDFGKAITFWRVSDLAFQGELTPPGASGWVRSIAISPDGKTMASWVRDHGALILRRLSDSSTIRTFPYRPGNFAFSPDGSLLAVFYFAENNQNGGHIAFWRVSDGTIVREITGIEINGHGLAFSPDGQLIAESHGLIYRVADGTLVHSMNAGAGDAGGDDKTVAFSPDGKLLAMRADYSTVRVYRTSDWQTVYNLQFTDYVQSLTFSSDSKWLAVGEAIQSRGDASLYDAATGHLVRTLPSSSGVSSVAFSPDSNVILLGSNDAHLRFWAVSDGTLLISFDQETGSPGSNFAGGVQSVGYSPDGKFVLYGRNDGTVCSILNPYLNTILPNHGGNTGNVTVKIVTSADFPLVTGTEVKLTADGQPPLLPISTTLDSTSPYVMTATFALNGAPLGKRNVVITLPNGTTRTFPQAFTVEQGTEPAIKTEVLGRSIIRGGAWTIYNVEVRNDSNVDASNVDVRLQFPKYFEWQLMAGQAQDIFEGGQNRSFSVNVPLVPPGSTVIPLRVKSPDDPMYAHAMFNVSAWVNPDTESSISYVGNLREPLVLRLHTSEAGIVEYLGQMENGIVTHINNIRVVSPSGIITTIAMNANGLPVSVQASNGYSINFSYPNSQTIMAAPFGPNNVPLPPIVYPLPTPIVLPPIADILTRDIDPCDLADLCRRLKEYLDKWATPTAVSAGFLSLYICPWLEGIEIHGTNLGNLCKTIAKALASPKLLKESRLLDKLCDYLDKLCRGVTTSGDPNDIVGVAGFGTQQWVSHLKPLPYTIHFENLPLHAPAAKIIVTNHLDAAKLDMTTVNLQSITFADHIVTPTSDLILPVGLRQFNADVDLRPERDLIVHINANLDMLTGDLIWHFTSIDPATGLPLEPDDPNGFLDAGQEGSVLYSVMPKPTVPTGTEIRNKATIIFDANAPMDTVPDWFNTIDADKPVSAVKPTRQTTTRIPLKVNAKDIGSGVRDISVSVSDNSSPYVVQIANSTEPELEFLGESGHTYAFKSRARDNVFNLEDEHSKSDIVVHVQANATVSGTITLQECQNSAQPVMIEFRPLDGSGNLTRTVALGANGSFQATVPAKRYQVAVKGRKWLRSVADVDARLNVTGAALTLRAGDVNNDNAVDLLDLQLLIAAFNTGVGSPAWNEAADLNCDQRVDISDLMLLVSNYNAQGMP